MAQIERSTESAPFPGMMTPAHGMAAMQGVAQSVMRGNMEVMSLVSRRTRAQMEFSKQAMASRDPAQIGQAGAQFWRDAFHDYADCQHRLMALWMQSMTSFGQGDFARQTAEFADRVTQPMTAAAEDTVTRMAEHPAEPWAWWRNDAAGARPSSNGNGHSAQESRGARAGY